MKSRIILFVLLLAISIFGYNQKLSELYKKDVIQLEPMQGFAQNANWKEIFKDYNSTENNRNLGQRKKIVVAPDGSVFMSHKTLHEIWKFDNKGDLVKKFGSKGGKPGQFINLPGVEGILDEKYLITDDNQGRINFFDLDGTFVKSFKLDYMPDAITPLKGGKIAILGYVPWKDSQSRTILRIRDISSGTEKEIWKEFSPYGKNVMISINFPHGGAMSCSLPYSHPMATRFRLAASKSGNLIVASPKTGEVKEFNPDGEQLNSFKLNIAPIKITDEDILEQYQQAVKSEKEFENGFLVKHSTKFTDSEKREVIESYKIQLENYKDHKYYPEYLPYFSSIVVDSDGNLLIFEFTKEEDKTSNKFKAYSYDMKGNLLGTSSFKSESLNLTFTTATFQFYNGYVYVVGNKSDDKSGPPRIVKMKLN